MEIPLADVNVSTDLALCRRCAKNYSYAELASAPATPVDLAKPPKGAWLTQTVRGFEVGASARHPAAFFLVPFTCIWSGVSLGGIYGSQIVKGRFNLSESLFGIPFLIGTIILGSITLVMLFGKTTVRVENKTSVHDLHATMLHCLGFDHEKLTYRHAGRDFRLTDVSGNVIKDVIA